MEKDHSRHELLFALYNADILALTIDIAVSKGFIDPRSSIADARLEYGEPHKYKFLDEETINKYKRKLGG